MKRLIAATLSASLIVALAGGAWSVADESNGGATVEKAAKKAKRGPRGPRGLRGPAGPRGFQGQQGGQGAQGPAGPAGIAGITSVDGPASFQCANGGGGCQVASSQATCPGGMVAIGGGFDASGIENIVGYAKRGATTYSVIAINYDSLSASVKAQVTCASGPGVTAAKRVAKPALDNRVEALRERLKR